MCASYFEFCFKRIKLTVHAQPPSAEGKAYFVGCSKWTTGERWEHIYAPIPSAVDEGILFQLMNGQPITSPDLIVYEGSCSTFLHPRHGKQKYCSQ
jgi:hypothetical protein